MLKNFKNALSSAEMRNIKGGNMPLPESGTCGYSVPSGAGFNIVDCGISKDQAYSIATQRGGHWCCDSCPSTRYCGNH